MALNSSNGDLMRKRREKVSRLRLQGLTEREIALTLPKGDDPIVDPDTGKPFSHVTIHADIEAMKKEWAKNAARDADEFINEELAKLIELEKTAWAKGRYEIVLRCYERRAKLLGLDKPTNISVDLPGLKAYIGVSPDQWDEPAKTEGST
jgi:hypothetical protein